MASLVNYDHNHGAFIINSCKFLNNFIEMEFSSGMFFFKSNTNKKELDNFLYENITLIDNKYFYNFLQNYFMIEFESFMGNTMILNEYYFGNSIKFSIISIKNTKFTELINITFCFNFGFKGTAISYTNLGKLKYMNEMFIIKLFNDRFVEQAIHKTKLFY